MNKTSLLLCSLAMAVLILSACHSSHSQKQGSDPGQSKPNRPSALAKGKFFDKAGKRMLYGGKRESQHFDVSNLDLKEGQFHYGLGREAFPALLEPEFISVDRADQIWKDDDRFLLAKAGSDTKAYSIKDLTRHEVVNDSLNGKPIFAAYCILADLGAIYDRKLGGREFTFALSGYTYYDPDVWDGLDGFVMWDRETESLWWPLIGKAVAGPLKGSDMKVLDEKFWKQTNWKDIRQNHPDAKVLRSGQDFVRPRSWPRSYEDIPPIRESEQSVAPHWGEVKGLESE